MKISRIVSLDSGGVHPGPWPNKFIAMWLLSAIGSGCKVIELSSSDEGTAIHFGRDSDSIEPTPVTMPIPFDCFLSYFQESPMDNDLARRLGVVGVLFFRANDHVILLLVTKIFTHNINIELVYDDAAISEAPALLYEYRTALEDWGLPEDDGT